MPLTHVIDPRKEKKNVNSAIYPAPPCKGLLEQEKCYPPHSGLGCEWKKINMG